MWEKEEKTILEESWKDRCDGNNVACKPITLLSFVYIHYHAHVMSAMKSMSIFNEQVNYNEIII